MELTMVNSIKEEKAVPSKPSLFEKVIFGSGDVGLNAMFTLFSSYVMFFYTDVIGMNAAIIGMTIMFCKIFDGISDIIAGMLIDKHKGKGGHCIPVIAKWTIPMALTVIMVFLVPDASIVIRVAYIFVTYNLFNTVMYTYVGLAHATLPTYVTKDSVESGQMFVFKMLFAAITQTIMAMAIMPMVNFFGGQTDQWAWVKSIMVFAAFGCVFLYLNVAFVKERVENENPAENLMQGIKSAVQNKYWILATLASLFTNFILTFNLSISVYYLNQVVGDMSLMGMFVMMCNLPGIVIMLIMPGVMHKISKKKLIIIGSLIMIAAQVVFIMAPADNIAILMGTALIRGIGFALPMGLVSALVGDSIEYGELKTGVRAQGILFSAGSLTGKIAGGLLTSVFGVFLTAVGYDGLAEVQAASAINGINLFFKILPLTFMVGILIIMIFWNVDRDTQMMREKAAIKK